MPREVVGEFSVSYLQILDENGKVDEALEPDISKKDLLEIYEHMVLAREFDGRMLKLQRQGRIGTFGPSTGQEAAHCVPAYLMTENDWFVGAFREAGGRLVMGESMEQALMLYNGYEEGNKRPGNSLILPMSIIVGSQPLHAVGIGYAIKYRNIKDSAAVCFFGDGATSQGDLHEAMNFAGVWKAPVVFICQNNQWAISLPREKQTASKTLAQKAIAYGIPGIQVDGNDPLAMYVITKEALDRAHSGEGPTFIEAVTYRLLMHTTADDPTRYRTEEEVEAWRKRDPLIRMRKYLEKKKFWSDKQQEKLDADVKAKIETAVKKFEAQTDFKPDTPFDYVYGTTHPVIEEQRGAFLEDLKQEVENG